jgi:hypothetical protein
MRFFMNDIDTGLMLKALKAVNDETRKVWG